MKATFATQARSAVRARATSPVVCMAFDAKKVAAGFGVGIASLALTGAAFAANVKLGADSGESLLLIYQANYTECVDSY